MAKEGARVKDRGGRQGPVSYREDLGFVMENHVSPQQLPSTSSVVAWSQGEGMCGLLRHLYNVTAAIFESLRVSVIHSTNIPRCRFEIILN